MVASMNSIAEIELYFKQFRKNGEKATKAAENLSTEMYS